MSFVKLDCGILNSTLWVDHDARDIFLTALLMAVPDELEVSAPQLCVTSLKETGWSVPAGWYGIVGAAGSGIIRQAGLPERRGVAALERLGAPERESRSHEFEGRRLVRIDGGYLVLNYMRYRERDYTAAERMRRYRERQKALRVTPSRLRVTLRPVTQADADADAEKTTNGSPPHNGGRPTWIVQCGEAWHTRYGGPPPYGKIGKHLKPLAEHPELLVRWTRYLEQTEGAYVSPARFAETFGAWGGNGSAPKSPRAGPHYKTADELDVLAGIPLKP